MGKTALRMKECFNPNYSLEMQENLNNVMLSEVEASHHCIRFFTNTHLKMTVQHLLIRLKQFSIE